LTATYPDDTAYEVTGAFAMDGESYTLTGTAYGETCPRYLEPQTAPPVPLTSPQNLAMPLTRWYGTWEST